MTPHTTRRLALWAGLLSLVPGGGALGSPVPDAPSSRAQEILEASDRARNGWDSFAVDVVISDERRGGDPRVSGYRVLIKGADQTLIRFTDPSDKGKLLLMTDGAMWFFLPTTSRPVRVTPLQRLAGNASNGDVAQTSYAANYVATLAGEELLDGRPTWVLELAARRKGATYQSIRYWIAKERLLPLQAEFRLGSGKATKRALFEEYQEVGGKRLLRRQVIVDLLRDGRRTVLEFRNYDSQDIPDKFFNKNYLGEL